MESVKIIFINSKASLYGMLLFLLICSFGSPKISGHWIITYGDPYELKAGDTLILEKKNYNDNLYEWGSGVQSGFEFSKDGNFREYHNVLCSTESSKLVFPDEKWNLVRQSDAHAKKVKEIIFIKGDVRNISFAIVSVHAKKMILVKLK